MTTFKRLTVLAVLLMALVAPARALYVRMKTSESVTLTSAIDMVVRYTPPPECPLVIEVEDDLRTLTITSTTEPCSGTIRLLADATIDGTLREIPIAIDVSVMGDQNYDATLNITADTNHDLRGKIMQFGTVTQDIAPTPTGNVTDLQVPNNLTLTRVDADDDGSINFWTLDDNETAKERIRITKDTFGLPNTAKVILGAHLDMNGYDIVNTDGIDFTLTGDVTSTGFTTTIASNSVALGTDTTGNYAGGTAEAGSALTGDSATEFFSTGAIEVARGGTGAAPGSDDQLPVSDSTTALTWRTVNDCTGTGKALTYGQSSNTFGCNTFSVPAFTLCGSVSIDPPSIGTSATGTATATVTGLATNDVCVCAAQTDWDDDLVLKDCRGSATDTIAVRLYHPTSGNLDASAQTMNYCCYH